MIPWWSWSVLWEKWTSQSAEACFFRLPWTLKVHLSKCEMRTMWYLLSVAENLLRKPLFCYWTSGHRPYYSHIVAENHWNKTLHCPAMIKKSAIHPWASVSIVTEQRWYEMLTRWARVISLNFCHCLTIGTFLQSFAISMRNKKLRQEGVRMENSTQNKHGENLRNIYSQKESHWK